MIFLWRGCVIFLCGEVGCLRHFVCGEVACFLLVERLCDFSLSLTHSGCMIYFSGGCLIFFCGEVA